MSRRLKVLMSAYACEPGKGSEPEVGWQWATYLAQWHDVTVVTRSNNRNVIEAELQYRDGSKPEFIYYDLPSWILKLKRKGLPIALYYLLWQIGVRLHLASRLETFDLVHHVTFNSFRQPGFWWRCPVPVILGPLGGGQICPWKFLSTFGRGRWKEAVRSLSVILSPLLPHLHLCFSEASILLAANRDTARRIPAAFQDRIQLMLETGIATEEIQTPKQQVSSHSTRFIWISRLEKIKAGTLAVEALALALKSHRGLSLTMIGDGPDREFLKQRVCDLGIESSVHFMGRVAKKSIPDILRQHDVFIFTSIRDTSGNVLLEAMAAGLPAITLKHHGAAEIATDETAIRVVPAAPAATSQAICQAMLAFSSSPEMIRTKGAAALQRAAEVYSWENKARRMDSVYREAIDRHHPNDSRVT